MDCNCPTAGVLEEIATSTCPFNLKQILRLAYNISGNVVFDSANGGGSNSGAPQQDAQVDTLAHWQARKAATDKSKIVISPIIGGDPIIEAGEATTEGGGDNTTPNGETLITGTDPSTFSAIFRSLTPQQEKSLKKLACESLEVYFFLQGGRIACENIDGGKRHRGLRITSFFMGDRGNEGHGADDKFSISFNLPAGWSENLAIVSPKDFNPIYDL